MKTFNQLSVTHPVSVKYSNGKLIAKAEYGLDTYSARVVYDHALNREDNYFNACLAVIEKVPANSLGQKLEPMSVFDDMSGNGMIFVCVRS